MFTIRQNTTFGLTKNEVMWEGAEKLQFNASGSDAKLLEVKALLKGIETSWFSHTAEVERLKTLLTDIDSENKKVSKQIDEAIENALKNNKLSQKERTDIQELQQRRTIARTELDQRIKDQQEDIKLQTGKETKEFIKDDSALSRLANLDGDSVVSDTSRDFVSERALKQAISVAAGKNQQNLSDVYKRVTGVDFPASPPSDDYEKFHNALRTQVAVVRELTGGGNAGLEVVLQGKTEAFVENI